MHFWVGKNLFWEELNGRILSLVAELKEKATKVAGVGVDKLQHVKDNNTRCVEGPELCI